MMGEQMSIQSDRLRQDAGKLLVEAKGKVEQMLAEAARLDSIYVPEPLFADGTSLVMFSKTHMVRGEEKVHYYSGVRDPENGNWLVAGTYPPPSTGFLTWDHLLEFIQGGTGRGRPNDRTPPASWVIWHGELDELTASGPAPAPQATCGHGQAQYSTSASSEAGRLRTDGSRVPMEYVKDSGLGGR